MKHSATILLLTANIFIMSCKSKSEKIPTTPFNIENLNNINVNSFNDSNLNSQGYNRILVDMLVYEKKIKDTIVQLEIDIEDGFIRTKNWKIKLYKSNKYYVQSFLQEKYGVIPLGNDLIKDSLNNNYSFLVIRHIDNSVFLCNVVGEDGDFFLKIIYHNPTPTRTPERSNISQTPKRKFKIHTQNQSIKSINLPLSKPNTIESFQLAFSKPIERKTILIVQ